MHRRIPKVAGSAIAPMLALALAMSLTMAAAAAGEAAAPGPYTQGDWGEAQRQAAGAALVVVAKVVEAEKPAGKGWDIRTGAKDNMASVDVGQKATVEVSEVLRGRLEPGTVTVVVKSLSMPFQAAYSMLNQFDGRRRTQRQNVPAAEFALVKGRTYLLFLSEAKPERDGDKGAEEGLLADQAANARPMEDPDAQLLASVRGFCRAMDAWNDPPKLPETEAARVAELIAELGSEDFETREKAEADLGRLGARIRRELETAAKDKDPERSFRAGALLKAAEPVPGEKEMLLDAATQQTPKPGTMKKRPEPKPEAEAAPGAEPGGDPGGLPELPPPADE